MEIYSDDSDQKTEMKKSKSTFLKKIRKTLEKFFQAWDFKIPSRYVRISAKNYQESKKRLQNLSNEEKEKKQQCYKNLSEDEKQRLVKYTKKYYRMRKNSL